MGDAGGCFFADQPFSKGRAAVLSRSGGESDSGDKWNSGADGDCGQVAQKDLSTGIQVQEGGGDVRGIGGGGGVSASLGVGRGERGAKGGY